MKAKITKIKGIYQKGKSFSNIGTYFMAYKGKKYYSGDVITIYDRHNISYNTIIVEENSKCYIYGFSYASINGNIDKSEISDIVLYKSYKDLKDGEIIFDFKICITEKNNITEKDNSDIRNADQREINVNLSAEVKLRLVEMDLYPLLDRIKDTNLNEEQKMAIDEKLHELGKQYIILYDIVKEHKYIEKNSLN
ncbi:hypothetical protein CPAST_c23900 [Clostridium pasteurianum DSM 525 = ATCC 6013]|uniref:Uncharacterized protein n=1 Tax=Clostridium pasteurianum DSM 525 = ATCC 6013 TaxID=1262449 RepID=A0A0H3JAD2_CLOPA|nr:hypothetical protein [Clostridium pasteurianum]AJA48460.1 hypothetical protein CPAST_c23900 [Clostridium pasteurianum DSM 525 = ATCC 6013]AJA52448.1 hypothetical protein CLPA_c23900 [Clostridium pasteurianum DSM 525 = ATCC 6013]AOZ75702.1 hypothetical protein AQ983_11620 [Clostridium pasteurianum DSM 525 = ATCC 6013]AOZ79498.1 hypothetical protein AQ984_11615 [Clostridium pasteurianum]ELP60392.1 hypothetical protein F502_02867 [Clostridium pasteurianum DSM 525 = ATCC 6013]